MSKSIQIQVLVDTSIAKAWEAWTSPDHIVHWNFASEDWHCPSASVDLRVGGKHGARMEAKDGSMGFDFIATFTEVEPLKKLVSRLDDNRLVSVEFKKEGNKTRVIEQFEIEDQNSEEMQRQGWQSILNNYRDYTEKI